MKQHQVRWADACSLGVFLGIKEEALELRSPSGTDASLDVFCKCTYWLLLGKQIKLSPCG